MLCHYVDKSCDHKHCNGGDTIFLVRRMTSLEHMCKGLCEVMVGRTSR